MLFDLRGRGRRRVVKIIYGGLAVLLGGGLVFFGIGGDVQGGLFDAFSQGGDATKQIEERVDNARAATQRDPRNPRNWAVLAEAEFQLAGQSEGFNAGEQDPTKQFTGDARKELEDAVAAWRRHLEVAGDDPNANTASIMRNALVSLGDAEGAVRAQEIVIDGLPEAGPGDYAQLAVLAATAGQTRKSDLAADRAEELAPKDQKAAVRAQIEQAKSQSGTPAAEGAAPVAPQPTTTP